VKVDGAPVRLPIMGERRRSWKRYVLGISLVLVIASVVALRLARPEDFRGDWTIVPPLDDRTLVQDHVATQLVPSPLVGGSIERPDPNSEELLAVEIVAHARRPGGDVNVLDSFEQLQSRTIAIEREKTQEGWREFWVPGALLPWRAVRTVNGAAPCIRAAGVVNGLGVVVEASAPTKKDPVRELPRLAALIESLHARTPTELLLSLDRVALPFAEGTVRAPRGWKRDSLPNDTSFSSADGDRIDFIVRDPIRDNSPSGTSVACMIPLRFGRRLDAFVFSTTKEKRPELETLARAVAASYEPPP
jgi:hypothetical protein